ncbi:MAG: hypothetical protein KBT27_13185 [Prevotellaceae bacterium]|nr:hypothetical protein [Candidatus Faecinaster equi]MCQ2153336.1 hypothetical protein [Bacteroidales bacterium]
MIPLFAFPAVLVPILYALLGGVGGFVVAAIIGALLPSNAYHIAIFGSKGAGKSTLWEQLQGIFADENYRPTVGIENVNQFTINYDGKEKVIAKSKDFGGGDDVVKYYGEVITEGTFIYYLINLTSLEEFKRETRARIKAIGKIIEEKKLKNKVGLRLVATNYKEFLKNNPGKDINYARAKLISVVGLKDVKDVEIEETVMVAELTDKQDIRQFFEQIVK